MITVQHGAVKITVYTDPPHSTWPGNLLAGPTRPEQRVLLLHVPLRHPPAADLLSHHPQKEPAPMGLGEPQLPVRAELMWLQASLWALPNGGAPASFWTSATLWNSKCRRLLFLLLFCSD